LGFLRLRLGDLTNSILLELEGKTAMIRELHVYGSLKAVGSTASVAASGAQTATAQHLGIGRTLLATAEEIADRHGYKQIAVISGIGVRGYYQKNGYQLEGTYMMKAFAQSKEYRKTLLGLAAAVALLFGLLFMLLW
jgi:elongator complex protein 3